MKKMICVGMFAFLFASSGVSVFAAEANGEQADGQTEVIYITDERPPMNEVEKGDGQQSISPTTGDSTVAGSLEILVIASAALLMLIIYLKKGETYYEKDD